MTTTKQDLTVVLNDHVDPAWPGANSLNGYFNATTFTVTPVTGVPAPVDYFLYGVVETVFSLRPIDPEFNRDLSNTERIDLYDDIIQRLTLKRDRLTALIATLTVVRDGIVP